MDQGEAPRNKREERMLIALAVDTSLHLSGHAAKAEAEKGNIAEGKF